MMHMRSPVRRIGLWLVAAAVLAGCSSADGADEASTTTSVAPAESAASSDVDPAVEANLVAAEEFIDAFYSYDPDELASVMATAQDALGEIGFYQGWAEGANYKVLERSCEPSGTLLVTCPITVEDDLLLALGSDFKVTDTFTVYAENGVITNVTTSSDDPEYSQAAWNYMYGQGELRAEGGPCEGFFDGGPTPGDCARAFVAGYAEYASQNPSG